MLSSHVDLAEAARQTLREMRDDPSQVREPLSIDLFRALCEAYRENGQLLDKLRVIIIDGTAYAAFLDISPLQYQIGADQPLHKQLLDFVDDFGGNVYEVSKLPTGWVPTAVSEVRLLGWWGIVGALLAAVLISVQSISDLHDYLTVVIQLLCVTFVLYGLVKTSPVGAGRHTVPRREFLSGNLGKLSNDDWAVGVIAVAAILLNLLALLLTTNSAISWDARFSFSVLKVVVHPIHWVVVGVLTLGTVVLISFYRTLAFYYWLRSRGETLERAKNQYLAEEHRNFRAQD